MLLSAILLVLFSLVASIDSLYFHIWRYRLHTRPQSRYEHLLHTANVCVFVPQVYLMFCLAPKGGWLLAAALLSLATLGIELADVICEGESRRDLGGLVPAEYAMHFLMSAFRAGFVAVFFARFKLADFAAPAALAQGPFRLIGWCIVLPGLGMA